MNYEGLDGIQLIDGNLVLSTSVGEYKEMKPYAYQLIDGRAKEIVCEYELTNTTVNFIFQMDMTKQLS